tara:strand:- start:6778 stop:10383 length:3606 start_codon:yes stop_codon:yes gene_type:complete
LSLSKYILFLLTFLIILKGKAQNHDVYLIGNLKGPKMEKRLRHLSQSIKQQSNGKEFTLLLLGDIRQKNLIKEDSLISFLKKIEQKNGKIIAVTGDRDWDKSSNHGLDTVAALEHRFNTKLGHHIFIPSKDCPGPTIRDIGNNIRIIGINSQWWLHPFRKALPVDSDCKNSTKVQILDELNEAIESAAGRQVIIMTHHPIISGGVYGGALNMIEHIFPFKHDKPNNKTFLPFYGSFYMNYRRNIGSTQDMSSEVYDSFIKDIDGVVRDYKNIIICSSHEYDMEVLKTNNNYQIISGALLKTSKVNNIENTLYASDKLGYIKLEVGKDSVWSKILLYDKLTNTYNVKSKFVLNDHLLKQKQKEITILSDNSKNKKGDLFYGGNYKANSLKKVFFGNLYRDAWTTPIEIPTLNLDTIFGGLTPLKEGGGLQTVSLKFVDKYGRKYAFRSINKNPIKSIPIEFRIDLVEGITQDMTATQHPYGALFVSNLLDSTNLEHEKAKLFVMPDDPKLGIYREKFAGMFGMLEQKPTELKDLKYSYAKANSVKGSFSVFKKIYDSPKHRIDTALFAKARIFDIFIGDWDRHEDNWKWLGYKKDSTSTSYKIYPKDRDHAFSRMDGLFYFLADREWGIPFRENFDYKFTGLTSLTNKGNHMDRMLLSGLSKEKWLSITDELMSEITDETIDRAQLSFPKEIQNKSGQIIAEKLKSRRKKLSKFIEKYYYLISKEVDILGTNKKEIFDVERFMDGTTVVKVISKKRNNEVLYKRTFKYSETKEIRLFGLGGVDSFYVHGTSYRNSLIRIIGGSEQDIVLDKSYVKEGSKKTLVYDYFNDVIVTSERETRVVFSDDSEINEYDQKSYKNNIYVPLPIFLTNPDDGISGGFALKQIRYGFGHKKYKSISNYKMFSSTNGATQIELNHKQNIARSNWFATGNIDFGQSFRFYRFFGEGNTTTFNDSINDGGFYKTRYKGAILSAGAELEFLEKSRFSINGIIEALVKNQSDESYFDAFPDKSLEAKNAGGAAIKLDIDFRDNPSFTNRGMRLTISNKSLISRGQLFGNIKGELSYYGTSSLLIPITLGVTIGSVRTFGDEIPYYHLANLGQSNNLRGYLQNRFSGKGSNYLNTDLRFHFGKLKSDFLPIYYGFSLFNDIGQILNKNQFIASKWHHGYGTGIYITPINKEFVTLHINVERSKEKSTFLKIKFGVLL